MSEVSSVRVWRCADYVIDCSKPQIMAIINTTPDSFSGDGLHGARDAAKGQAEAALAAGATILDIGGESSRPGSLSVSVQEELDRVIPVVEDCAALGVPISVDTVKPDVMRASIAAGAAIINDINALQAPGAVEAVAESGAGVCLMHMQGAPRSMQQNPTYPDVVEAVRGHLLARAAVLAAAGVARERIALDPGFGFGKTLAHNIALFRALPDFLALNYPLLIGVSRKTMLGEITGQPVSQRATASAAAALLAVQRGAHIVRVHDVVATRDALAVLLAIEADLPRAY